MIRNVDIAWVAGLLEGESTFLMSGRSIAVVVSLTDHDVVLRAASLLEANVYTLDRHLKNPRHKRAWRAQVKGPRAAGWMMTIWPLLGRRRRQQVEDTLAEWRAMRFVRTSAFAERGIGAAFRAGIHNKSRLARRYGVARQTVYRVLRRSGLEGRVCERALITPVDIAWLAGLVEGEGNISVNGRSFTVRVKMTDRDVVARAADLLSAALYERDPGGGRKRTWTAQVKGDTAAGWAMTLYPWLGIRRREQVRTTLAKWKTQRRGVLSTPIADLILEYRRAGWTQEAIMRELGVGKSTVYRHTKDRVARYSVRWAKREFRSPVAAYC